MALKIYEKFAPRANPGDTNYPNGSIKNESAPGTKDGTPLDADWGNDYAGFDAALFAEAGVTPSGDPDTAVASQRLDALKLLHINNLSLPCIFDTVAHYKAFSIAFPVGKLIKLLDRNAEFTVISGTGSANGRNIIGSTSVSQSITLVLKNTIILSQWGLDGVNDTSILQDALDYANGRTVDIKGASNLNGTISGVTNINIKGSKTSSITVSDLLTFDNTNVNIYWEDVHFDSTSVPNGTSVSVLVENTGIFESINSDVQKAPRGNLLLRNMNYVTGWGGDFSDAGQENFNTGGVNIGVGLHIFGVKVRGRWYNPVADDCFQIGVFINGDGVDICHDTIVYNASAKNAQDNGVRVQPEDTAYSGCQDCGFVNPIVDGSLIDNIRINGTRCFAKGGVSTNATGWACKTDGGTDIVMDGIKCRGNAWGVGGRVDVDLNGLKVTNIDTDNPSSSPALYCVQTTATADVRDVAFENNTTEGGTQSDLAIILIDRTKGVNLTAKDNTYKGDSTSNYREVWGVVEKGKSINNSAPQDGGDRAFINLSNCSNTTILNFDGIDDSGAVLWGIEANNGTVTSKVGKSAFLGRTSTLVGGVDSAQVADITGNI